MNKSTRRKLSRSQKSTIKTLLALSTGIAATRFIVKKIKQR